MKQDVLTMAGGDTTDEQQYLETTRRSEHLEPERALLLAMLEDAIHNFRNYAKSKDRMGKDRFREAAEWIMHTGNGWIFTFDNVCELLGLDPDYIRRGILESKETRARKRNPLRGATIKQAERSLRHPEL